MAIIEFKPHLHPRNRVGRFIEVLNDLKPGDSVRIENRDRKPTIVQRRKSGAFRVSGGRFVRGLRGNKFDTWSPEFAAKAGLDSAADTPLLRTPPRPGQLGGFQKMTPAQLASPGVPSEVPGLMTTVPLRDVTGIVDKQIPTPWGQSDHIEQISPDVIFAGTPGHGGFGVRVGSESHKKLSPDALAFSEQWSHGKPTLGGYQWFEEDSGGDVLAKDLPDLFPTAPESPGSLTIKYRSPKPPTAAQVDAARDYFIGKWQPPFDGPPSRSDDRDFAEFRSKWKKASPESVIRSLDRMYPGGSRAFFADDDPNAPASPGTSQDVVTPEGLIRPEVPLVGEDGDAFAIMGRTTRALKDAGNSKEVVDDYTKQATSGDYDHLLRVTMAFTKQNAPSEDDNDEPAISEYPTAADVTIPEGLVKPVVPLVGENGDAFSILGRTDRALKDAGNSKEVRDSYKEQAMSGDYDKLLRVTMAFTRPNEDASSAPAASEPASPSPTSEAQEKIDSLREMIPPPMIAGHYANDVDFELDEMEAALEDGDYDALHAALDRATSAARGGWEEAQMDEDETTAEEFRDLYYELDSLSAWQLLPDAPESPGTDDNAAKSKRIADIDFEKQQLAARWRDMKASGNPLDQADAIELDARIKALTDEREQLSREILRPDASPESPGTMGVNDVEAKIADLQKQWDSSVKFWENYSHTPEAELAHQSEIEAQIKKFQAQRDAMVGSLTQLPEPPDPPESPGTTMPKEQFEAELSTALDKSFAAWHDAKPEGWHIKDNVSGKQYYSAELPFGFAWVTIEDGRGPLARAFRRSAETPSKVDPWTGLPDKNPSRVITLGDHKVRMSKRWQWGSYRGMQISLPNPPDAQGSSVQSYDRQMAQAEAFAQHLRDLGFQAGVEGRLD